MHVVTASRQTLGDSLGDALGPSYRRSVALDGYDQTHGAFAVLRFARASGLRPSVVTLPASILAPGRLAE
jgi:hypothetical protein